MRFNLVLSHSFSHAKHTYIFSDYRFPSSIILSFGEPYESNCLYSYFS